MKQIDEQKALHYILKKVYGRTDKSVSYSEWLYNEGLLAGDEVLNEEEKFAVYGKVMITQSEKERLELHYTQDELAKVYEKLNTYLANRSKRPYKSHYAAMNSWVIEGALGFKRSEPLPKVVKHWNDE